MGHTHIQKVNSESDVAFEFAQAVTMWGEEGGKSMGLGLGLGSPLKHYDLHLHNPFDRTKFSLYNH